MFVIVVHQVYSLLWFITWVDFVITLFCRQKFQGMKNVRIQKFIMDLSIVFGTKIVLIASIAKKQKFK